MALDQDRIKSINRQYPKYIPLCVGILPAAWMKYRDDLYKITQRYPDIFGISGDSNRNFDEVGGTYVAGEHVDAWGCVWSNVKTGREAIVTGHPLPQREMVLPVRIELTTSALPRMRSTTELRQHRECAAIAEGGGAGKGAPWPLWSRHGAPDPRLDPARRRRPAPEHDPHGAAGPVRRHPRP